MGQGEAVYVKLLLRGRPLTPYGQGPAPRLPERQLHRLMPDVLKPQFLEALQAELLCPAIGGVAGPPDPLGEDLRYPAIGDFLGWDQLVDGHRVFQGTLGGYTRQSSSLRASSYSLGRPLICLSVCALDVDPLNIGAVI